MKQVRKKSFRILATSFDYRPRLGGVATCAYEVCRALSRMDGVELKILAPISPGSEEFDLKSGVNTVRKKVFTSSARSVPVLTAQLSEEIARFKPDVVLNFLWFPGGVSAYFSPV